MKITTKFFLQFVREHGSDKPEGISMVEHFKLWLKSKIETSLDKLPHDDFIDASSDTNTVMNITFTYDNAIVVKILAERGEALKERDWDGVAKAEAKIEELKRTNLKQLTYPTSAFITFKSEEGCFKAIRFNKLCSAMPSFSQFYRLPQFLQDHRVDFEGAPEPSDIIWENRKLSSRRTGKKTVAYSIILLAVLASFVIIFYGINWQFQLYAMFPAVLECQQYEEQYGS